MKQKFKLLLLLSLVVFSNAFGDFGKPLQYNTLTHKHNQSHQGFLPQIQTTGGPVEPPKDPEPQPEPVPEPQPQPQPEPQPQPQPEPQPQPQPTNTDTTTTEESSGAWGIFFAVVIVILLVVGIVYVYNMYQEHVIKTEGTMKAELGIKKQVLNSEQQMVLNLLTFNKDTDGLSKPFYCEDVVVKHQKEEANKVVLGEYLQAIFSQPMDQNSKRLILCNYPCNQKMDCSYFEVEIEQINTQNYEQYISIGFIAKSQLDRLIKENTPKDYEKLFSENKTVEFSSLGEVTIGNTLTEVELEQMSYGDTMGIGYTKKDQRIWITKNGEFLNPPPMEEIKRLLEATKKKNSSKDEEEQTQRVKEQTQEEIQEEKLRKERVFKLTLSKVQDEYEAVYPFVSSNFNCTININIGGYPFRFNQKEIATGLLK